VRVAIGVTLGRLSWGGCVGKGGTLGTAMGVSVGLVMEDTLGTVVAGAVREEVADNFVVVWLRSLRSSWRFLLE
jgi:hypothetical protein